MARLHSLSVVALAVCFAGCDAPAPKVASTTGGEAQAPPAVAAGSTLVLRASPSGGDTTTLDVVYTRAGDQPGPRQVELWVQLTPNLELVSSEAGDAALAADKQVVAQAREGHEVRVMAFGTTSLATLDSGVIARLHLRRTDDTPASVEFIERMPAFAPVSAQHGLRLPEEPTMLGRGGGG